LHSGFEPRGNLRPSIWLGTRLATSDYLWPPHLLLLDFFSIPFVGGGVVKGKDLDHTWEGIMYLGFKSKVTSLVATRGTRSSHGKTISPKKRSGRNWR